MSLANQFQHLAPACVLPVMWDCQCEHNEKLWHQISSIFDPFYYYIHIIRFCSHSLKTVAFEYYQKYCEYEWNPQKAEFRS